MNSAPCIVDLTGFDSTFVDLTIPASAAADAANSAMLGAAMALAAANAAVGAAAACAAAVCAQNAAMAAAVALAAALNANMAANNAAMLTPRPLVRHPITDEPYVVPCGENHALTLLNEQLAKFGLLARGWRPVLDRAKRRLGVTKYGPKTIGLSRYMVNSMPEAVVYDTILHEVAHALVGPGHGHGPVWKAKAAEIGYTGARCGPQFSAPKKYVFKCKTPGCSASTKFHKRTKRKEHLFTGSSRCKRCKRSNTFERVLE